MFISASGSFWGVGEKLVQLPTPLPIQQVGIFASRVVHLENLFLFFFWGGGVINISFRAPPKIPHSWGGGGGDLENTHVRFRGPPAPFVP